MSLNKVAVFCDGASKGNPGHSSIGGIAYKVDQDFHVSKLKTYQNFHEENALFSISKYLGIQTNNYAEYQALLESLKKLLNIFSDDLKSLHLFIFMDSELIVKQINGLYKVKNQNLKKIHEEIKRILSYFSKWEIHYIPREQNTIADRFANLALKDYLKD